MHQENIKLLNVNAPTAQNYKMREAKSIRLKSEIKGALIHRWWACKLRNHYGKQHRASSKTKNGSATRPSARKTREPRSTNIHAPRCSQRHCSRQPRQGNKRVPFERCLHKGAAHTHNGRLLIPENTMLPFATHLPSSADRGKDPSLLVGKY